MAGFTRREAVAGAGAALIAAEAVAQAPARKPVPCAIAQPMGAIANRLLDHAREIAVYNGTAGALDGGAHARAMDDHSPAGDAAWRAALATAERDLAALACVGDDRGALHLTVARAVVGQGTASAAIRYGRPNPFWYSGHIPYVVSQVAGPHIDVPNAMVAQQSLATPAAIDAWIAKLDGFDTGFAGVIEKLRADEAAGCRPPAVTIAKAIPVCTAFGEGRAEDHPLIVALRERTAAAGIDSRIRSAAERRAITALDRRARPALARLGDQLRDMLPRGRTEAGLWAQPDGDALYAINVRNLGDTPRSPQDVHRIGLNEVSRISAQMDALLRREGLTRGGVGPRMEALAKRPGQIWPDSDAGRAALLDHLRGLVRAAEAQQPQFLPAGLVPEASLEVRRVPPASQAGAPGGYYDGPSLDGSRPGIYWINLRDMSAVPKLGLPTLSYHEGVPGHHTQGAIATALGEAPLLLRLASFNAYQEGWALYAERLMAERGAYRGDRPGDLGRLQAELFRACRLVVDTGIHALRWEPARAIAFMAEKTGNPVGEVTAEIERYMAWPGQALGYKLGQLRLLELRAAARRRKGKRFSLKAFHGAVLGNGAMPLDLVERAVGEV
ncbi:DUF885 domain-containing protein [Sphingomonas sp. 1P06PA]|uniref:DUF885 domain-containing protein n=1 Tax=Sphingomonas sp. 1P06PA TaxID=554121 RepID=UPI0039A4CC67